MSAGIELTFWGVRGTLPVSSEATRYYGGNTSCVEVRVDGKLLILDAGSGLYHLGRTLKDQEIDLLLSHTHIDHVLGLPFFAPAYEAGRKIRLWAGHLLPESTLEAAIDRLMGAPLFPVTRKAFRANVEYINYRAGETITVRGIEIGTLPLNHPDRATGYRISHQGKSVCYITDIEHLPAARDPALLEFVRGADCMIYDATFSDENFPQHAGWGHSTWQEAVRLKEAAGVDTLVLFHHDPAATDAELDERMKQAESLPARILTAREGMRLTF